MYPIQTSQGRERRKKQAYSGIEAVETRRRKRGRGGDGVLLQGLVGRFELRSLSILIISACSQLLCAEQNQDNLRQRRSSIVLLSLACVARKLMAS